MAKQAQYNAAEHIATQTNADPYQRPAFVASDRARRFVWNLCWTLLYRPSLRPMHNWRAFLLRCFGASLGPECKFHPGCCIWAPWNLVCADRVTVADKVEIYNPSPLRIGSHAVLSQAAYICGATHDYDDPAFPLIAFAMQIGAYAWIGKKSSVAPGVCIGEGAVLGMGSVATRDLEPWSIYAGVPAVKMNDRQHTA